MRVPQESLLGPYLFNMLIKDMDDEVIESNFLLFSDDIKFFTALSDIKDNFVMQHSLNKISVL